MVSLTNFESEAKRRMEEYPFRDIAGSISLHPDLINFRSFFICDRELFKCNSQNQETNQQSNENSLTTKRLHQTEKMKQTKKRIIESSRRPKLVEQIPHDESALELNIKNLSKKLFDCPLNSIKFSFQDNTEDGLMKRSDSNNEFESFATDSRRFSSFEMSKKYFSPSVDFEESFDYAVLLTFGIYRKKSDQNGDHKSHGNQRYFSEPEYENYELDQEFTIDARSSLCLLKDSFYCSKDFTEELDNTNLKIFKKSADLLNQSNEDNETSENILAHLINTNFLKKKCPSGFLNCGNAFYNDMRSSQSIDYSAPIISWLSERESGKDLIFIDEDSLLEESKEHFKTSSEKDNFPNSNCVNNCNLISHVSSSNISYKMEDFKFMDLDWDLHSPCILQHHGNCVHLVVPRRIKFSKNIPKGGIGLKLQRKIKRKRCSMCDLVPASLITLNDKYSPSNPCYFCNCCYDSFHLDSSGNQIYDDYEVFRYFHDN